MSAPTQFRKKPVVISAIQWTGENLVDVIHFTDGRPPNNKSSHAGMMWDQYVDVVRKDGLKIFTMEGKMNASIGDWIIKGVKGEHYPCKPEIFALTYDDASASTDLSQAAVASALEAAARIVKRAGHSLDEEIRALITPAQHDALAAANARADQARNAALVEAANEVEGIEGYDNIGGEHPLVSMILALRDKPAPTDFQKRVDDWIVVCFGEVIRMDGIERNHRFLEESLELVQSLGCTKTEAHLLVDYVFNRDAGEPAQEVGGAMNTLAALCTAHGLDMAACGETELARVWTKVESIRAKQAAKPKHSPLPQHTSDNPAPAVTVEIDLVQVMFAQLCEAAKQSNWIPQEHYYANDWVSDCCDFLRTGRGAIAGGGDE